MLKREIKYTDFNDEEVTDVFYFNLSESELLEMEVDYEGGMLNFLNKIIETRNGKELIKYFKILILQAYGQKSDDGKRFIKNEKLREEFSQMAAYHVLFIELASDAGKAAEFIMGTFPKKMMTPEVQKEMQTKLAEVNSASQNA